MPCPTTAAKYHTWEPSCWDCCPNRFSRPERARCSNYNVAVIASNHHNEDTIRVCISLSNQLLQSQTGLTKYEARLQAQHRYLDTRSDGNIVKVFCRIAVDMIQQNLGHTDSRPCMMSHSTEFAVAIATTSVRYRDREPERIQRKDERRKASWAGVRQGLPEKAVLQCR